MNARIVLTQVNQVNKREPKFTGDYQQLQDIFLLAGITGEWTDIYLGKQFKTTSGAILSWWPSTGTLEFEGKPIAKDHLIHSTQTQLAKSVPNKPVDLKPRWNVVDFGKYKTDGKSWPQIAILDPAYFFSLFGGGKDRGPLRNEIFHVAALAQRIVIPRKHPELFRIAHTVLRRGSYSGFNIVPRSAAQPSYASQFIRQLTLDLSILLRRWPEDRLASERMSRSIVKHYFGGIDPSREQCEQFFDDIKNFEI